MQFSIVFMVDLLDEQYESVSYLQNLTPVKLDVLVHHQASVYFFPWFVSEFEILKGNWSINSNSKSDDFFNYL